MTNIILTNTGKDVIEKETVDAFVSRKDKSSKKKISGIPNISFHSHKGNCLFFNAGVGSAN